MSFRFNPDFHQENMLPGGSARRIRTMLESLQTVLERRGLSGDCRVRINGDPSAVKKLGDQLTLKADSTKHPSSLQCTIATGGYVFNAGLTPTVTNGLNKIVLRMALQGLMVKNTHSIEFDPKTLEVVYAGQAKAVKPPVQPVQVPVVKTMEQVVVQASPPPPNVVEPVAPVPTIPVVVEASQDSLAVECRKKLARFCDDDTNSGLAMHLLFTLALQLGTKEVPFSAFRDGFERMFASYAVSGKGVGRVIGGTAKRLGWIERLGNADTGRPLYVLTEKTLKRLVEIKLVTEEEKKRYMELPGSTTRQLTLSPGASQTDRVAFLERCSNEYLRLVRALADAEEKAITQAPALEKLNSKITAKLAEIAELETKLALARRTLDELSDDRSQLEAECELLSPDDIKKLKERVEVMRRHHDKFQVVKDVLTW